MVHLPSSLAEIKVGDVSLFYCVDPNLGNLPLLIFYGLSTSTATTSNARIQVHIIHPAGAWSQPRLTVSPNSPIYDVVSYMDPFWQSDEVCRGLAYGINKFFGELSDGIKKAVITRNIEASSKRRSGSGTPQRDTPQRSTPQRSDQRRGYRDRSETPTTPTQSPSVELFSKQHAANLACSLVRIENVAEVLKDVEAGFRQQFLSNLDIDLVLPPGSIRPLSEGRNPEGDDEDFDEDKHQYGVYSALVKQFGEGCFLPTTKIKRAPSRALNRSKSFLKDQKLSLRREMSELVDTEERYVTKIYDLVYNVAEKFRKAARERHERSQSPSVEDVMRLFPKSLDEILQVNKGFLRAIQHVMDETEDAAMEDLEKDEPTFSRRRFDGGRQRDPTGAAAFAKVMLEWFPKFFDCYQNYIRASGHFPDLLSTWMRQPSSFSQRVKSSGEQKLKSSIIEPVQRLPRYSLYIDNIVNYLPATHPAQAQMLKARDIITAICSLDPRETDKENPQIWQRLKAMVYNWPSTFQPQGRLISAVDFVEMAAPYHLSANAPGSVNGILLLFADSVVVCKCSRDSTVSARGVLAEVDKPSTAAMMAAVSNATSGSAQALASKGLIFMERYPLNSARFTESDDNRAVWLTNSLSLEKNPQTPCRRAFLLRGAYDGKAFKWSEEVAKARIEGRFSDQERESDNWELRHVVLKDAGLNVYTSVFAEGIDSLIEGRKDPAPLRIVVDREKGTKGAPVGHYGVEIAGNISVIEHQGHVSYHVTFDGLNDRRFSDFADDSTLASTFCKRGKLSISVAYTSFMADTFQFLPSFSITSVRRTQP